MPTVNKGETKDDFVKRCIPIVIKDGTAEDNKQAVAICNNMYAKKETNEWIKGVELAEDAEPKKEIMLFPYGYFNHELYGVLDFTDRFHKEIIKNFKENALGIEPFMDAEHNKGKALAWFREAPYYRQGLGTFIKPEYTELGKQVLGDKEYKYFSPWFEDFKDPITKKVTQNVFRGGGATNIPFLKTMPSIVQDLEDVNKDIDVDGKKKDISINIKLSEIFAEVQSDNDKIDNSIADSLKTGMDEGVYNKNLKESNMTEELKKHLIKIYKLDEDASDEDVEKAVAADVEKPVDAEKEDVKEEEEVAEDKKELQEQVNKLEKQLTEEKAEKVIVKAISDGKFGTVDKKFWTGKFLSDPKGTEDTINHLKKTINLSEKGISGKTEETIMSDCTLLDEAKKLYAEERKINQNITLSECIVKVRQDNPELGKDYEKKYFTDPKRFVKRF